ncbi:MAG: hypothetical protein K2O38_03845 [Muribaculaceae bacterium]|nr:hypothetical protein [Muribaculaceae bacterium]
MSKLIIPAAELIGTPLTQEELKGILAGATTYSCSCLLKVLGATGVGKEFNGITTEKECRSECKNLCSNTKNCYDFSISFSAIDS